MPVVLNRCRHFSISAYLGDLERVKGEEIPDAALGWASFPCQDLSRAADLESFQDARSGLVWQWLRLIDENDRRQTAVARRRKAFPQDTKQEQQQQT